MPRSPLITFAFITLTFLAVASTSATAASDIPDVYHVGETNRLFHPGHVRHWRGAETQALVTRFWYPVAVDIPEIAHDIGTPNHPIFHGHPIAADAPLSPLPTRHPLLLLSHGTGGSADSLDWLGATLAAAGYIVVGVNHPGNNALEPLTADGFALWWERATDISDALDGVLADPTFAAHIDQQRIGAIGFSLGGYTMLELAGARTDLRAFEDFCRSPQADAICRPPEMDNLQEPATLSAAPSAATLASRARAGASYRDQRIKAVFAIAPALGQAFDAASFDGINIPVSLLGGSADVTVPVMTNISWVARFLPKARVTLLPGVSHYTFLDTCITAGADHPPAFCKDNPGIDRDAIHAQTIEKIRTFFDGTL